MRTVIKLNLGLVILTLLLSTAVATAAAQTSERSAEKAASSKSTKKKKKKSARSAVYVGPRIVINRSVQTVALEVPAVPRVDTSPVVEGVAPATPPRRTVRAAKTTGIHVNPITNPTPNGVDPTATAGQLIISEFRVRGPNGAEDEFIEIYNNSGASHTVTSASGTGYGVAASDGTTRCSIPNGTIMLPGGHFLCVNSDGYSIGAYPAGATSSAGGDVQYTVDIPDNVGIALFNNNTGGGNYVLANRLDAVGSTSEANTLYKEGTGYPALTPFSIEYSFVRDECGKGGSITTFGPCTISTPKDTDNNAADFYFVDTNGTSAGAGQRLGAPAPENTTSPTQRNAEIPSSIAVPCVAATADPNRVRDFTSAPAQNSTFGTIAIRKEFTNGTPFDITRLRFRIIDLTTFPAPTGVADLRPRTSADSTTPNPACNGGGTLTLLGTTLEQPPSQLNGGGFNSSLSPGTITPGTPIPPNGTIIVNFLFGIQQTGSFKVYVNMEAGP